VADGVGVGLGVGVGVGVTGAGGGGVGLGVGVGGAGGVGGIGVGGTIGTGAFLIVTSVRITKWSVIFRTSRLSSRTQLENLPRPRVPKIQSTGIGFGGGVQMPALLRPPFAAFIGASPVIRQKYGARSFMSPVTNTGSPVV